MRLSVALFLLIAATGTVEGREWSDASGKFTFEADLVRVDETSVVLRLKDDQSEHSVPIVALSEKDRVFVRAKSPVSTRVAVVPAPIMTAIKQAASTQWPGDYSMQRFEIDKQQRSYLAVANYSDPSLPKRVLSSIVKRAKTQWKDDYAMQKFEMDKQCSAYHSVKGYRAPRVPKQVLNQIVRKAVQDWPQDYAMQKFEINKQVKAYADLHR